MMRKPYPLKDTNTPGRQAEIQRLRSVARGYALPVQRMAARAKLKQMGVE